MLLFSLCASLKKGHAGLERATAKKKKLNSVVFYLKEIPAGKIVHTVTFTLCSDVKKFWGWKQQVLFLSDITCP